MNVIGIFITLLFTANFTTGQNLVLNGSFEEFGRCPQELGDFFPHKWYSIASNSTPDLFSYCARKVGSANPDWLYSRVKPLKDSSYVGIVVADKKTTYREYLGTRLASTLLEDSTYIIEVSLAVPYGSAYTIQSLELIFSDRSFFGADGYTIIELEPSITVNLDNLKTDGTWTTFSFEYEAKGNESHLGIGNFKSKKETVLSKISDRTDLNHKAIYNNAYLCIDEVNIQLLSSTVKEHELPEPTKFQQKESPIIVNGIHFKSGSAQIENDNISELDEIAQIMLDNTELALEITGYTDNSGTEVDNKQLSLDRALNVKDYLVDRGIEDSRINTYGKGSQNPIGDNNTEAGKLQNRRIEVILQ